MNTIWLRHEQMMNRSFNLRCLSASEFVCCRSTHSLSPQSFWFLWVKSRIRTTSISIPQSSSFPSKNGFPVNTQNESIPRKTFSVYNKSFIFSSLHKSLPHTLDFPFLSEYRCLLLSRNQKTAVIKHNRNAWRWPQNGEGHGPVFLA